MSEDVIIIGAGLAGLAAAVELKRAGRSALLIEASDGVGGRVRTDWHEGFGLDRGFQVLLTAYPEARRVLDYEALKLQSYYPGAMVRTGGRLERIADPFRRPLDGVKTALVPVGTLMDKLRVAALRGKVLNQALSDLYERPDYNSTHDWLREFGFSEQMVDTFFRPFYGGVLLDDELKTSSKMMEFTYKMFSEGDTALPLSGIGAISDQLASRLDAGRILLNTKVKQVGEGVVSLDNGEQLKADHVIIATELHHARELLGARMGYDDAQRGWRGVTCLYFSAPEAPVSDPILILNGEGSGPVNNVSVPSLVSARLAPAGRHLISASVLGAGHDHEALLPAVLKQMTMWFGAQVRSWEHLRTYDIPYAQPDQRPPQLSQIARPVALTPGLYVCGDHRETSSIEGAMRSGRRAAEAVELASRGR